MRGVTDSGEDKGSAQDAVALPHGDEGERFSTRVRVALGLTGAGLALGGLGGLGRTLWRRYPAALTSSAFLVAGGTGAAMVAVAAQGRVPSFPDLGSEDEAPRLFALKTLNDAERFSGELQALAELRGSQVEPAEPVELEPYKATLFVLDFPGAQRSDTGALDRLRLAVTLILAARGEGDEVLLRLTSPGGPVAYFGLATAQLQRIRSAGLPLTVCVDTVAASGGYMMACVADHIVAAPFATVGSIGVIAGVPNLHRLLERNNIEFQQVTAGKYKRTVNVLTPNTEEGLSKFREELEAVHVAFKDHVGGFRPELDMEEVATGEAWLGAEAQRRGLVDALGTSDDVLLQKAQAGFRLLQLQAAMQRPGLVARLLSRVDAGKMAASFLEGIESLSSKL